MKHFITVQYTNGEGYSEVTVETINERELNGKQLEFTWNHEDGFGISTDNKDGRNRLIATEIDECGDINEDGDSHFFQWFEVEQGKSYNVYVLPNSGEANVEINDGEPLPYISEDNEDLGQYEHQETVTI